MEVTFLDALAAGLREPVAMLLDPSRRIYWGFLVSAAMLAVLLHLWRARTSGPRLSVWGIWAHRSALLDYKLVFANSAMRAVLAAAWTLSAFGIAVALVARLDGWLGAPPVLALSTMTISLIYTIVLFVAWDLSRYVLHRLMHGIPSLWELHKVHHSAEVLTPVTLYRVHPVESVLYSVRGALVTGLVTGVFFWLFRRDAIELELLGVNLLGFLFNFVGANLRHSHVWWSWGRRVERWLISPAQHQLHHARGGEHGNLGTWLAVWDRLGGTLHTADVEPPGAFGLAPAESNHHPHGLVSALWAPLRAAFVPRR